MYALAFKTEDSFDWTIDYNNQYEYESSANADAEEYRYDLIRKGVEIKVVEL